MKNALKVSQNVPQQLTQVYRIKIDKIFQNSNLHWLPVTHRIEFKIAMLVHKCIYGVTPQYLSDLIKIKESSRYQLRSYRGILLMDNTYRTKKTLGDRAFENAAPKVWNRLPLEIRQCQSLNIFKVLLKTHLFKLAFY